MLYMIKNKKNQSIYLRKLATGENLDSVNVFTFSDVQLRWRSGITQNVVLNLDR